MTHSTKTDAGLRTNDAVAWLVAAVALQLAAHPPFWTAAIVFGGLIASALVSELMPRAGFVPAAVGGLALAAWQITTPLPAASPRRALLVLGLVACSALIAAAPHSRRTRAARVMSRGAALLAALAVSLGSAEQLSIWFLSRDLYVIEALPESATPSLYTQSDTLKWRYTPGFVGRFTHPEYAGERFVINPDGYRDEPWPPAEHDPSTVRLLFLGDSFGVGFGVEETESYPSVVARLLGAAGDAPKVESFNACVAGYGPAEQLLVLPELLDRVRPDYVIAAFYDGNDLDDIRVQLDLARLPFALPTQLAARGGNAVSQELKLGASLSPFPSLLAWRYWKQHTTVGRLVNDRGRVALAKIGLGSPDAVFSTRQLRAARRNADDMQIDEEIEVARLCYRAIATACNSHGVASMLVRIPGRTQSSPREWETLLGDLDLDSGDFNRVEPGARLLQETTTAGTIGVDLLSVLDPGDEPTTRYYYAEGHLNQSGHAAAAAAIAAAISQHTKNPNSTSVGEAGEVGDDHKDGEGERR